MITIDDKTYRNLQEQVGFNTEVINKLIKNTFLNIKGLVNTIGELPTTDISDGTFYLVGIIKPYQLYIYFENKWINLGDFKVEAIDGKNGEQGVPGHTPVITIGNNLNWFIDGVDTGVTAKGQNGVSIRGPQGIRGENGVRGPQGDPGLNAFQYTVIDELTSTDDLPSPLGTPRNYAYLVNDDLYIIIGDNLNLMWKNVGQLGGTIIQNYTVGNPEGEASAALTKLQIDDKIFSVVSKDSDLFNTNQLAAINSGITSDSVKKIQNNTESINIINQNVNQLASTVESNKNDINSKVDELASATESALTQYNQMINSKQPLLVSGTNIKTINNQSILGSGNLDLLQDQKLNVSIECDHEYEITGKTGHEYGVAIEDSQMLLKKIQGQTRRYSLNVIKPKTYTSNAHGLSAEIQEDGSIIFNGTPSQDAVFYIEFQELLGTYSLRFDGINPSTTTIGVAHIGNITSNAVKTWTWTTKKLFAISYQIKQGTVCNKYVIKPMLVEGTYTDETMPPFQPYDDTLVNSKCNLISTGRNLLDINNVSNGYISNNDGIITSTNDGIASDFIYLKNNCTISAPNYSSSGTNAFMYRLSEYDAFKNWIKTNILTQNQQTITLDRKTSFVRFSIAKAMSDKVQLVYGDTAPTEYEPYTKEELPINVELGAYDYIDNVSHLLVRQTSDAITFDGSEDENWSIASYTDKLGGKVFVARSVDGIDVPIVCNKIKTYNYSYLDEGGHGLGINATHNIRIYGTDFDTIEEFNTWLSQSPIQVAYKLATPTTTRISLPAGYAVYTGGLQQQVIEGKYLPYVLHKSYSVSVPSQILANIEIDRAQQDIIYCYYQQVNERINRAVQGINAQIAQINKRLSQLEG